MDWEPTLGKDPPGDLSHAGGLVQQEERFTRDVFQGDCWNVHLSQQMLRGNEQEERLAKELLDNPQFRLQMWIENQPKLYLYPAPYEWE